MISTSGLDMIDPRTEAEVKAGVKMRIRKAPMPVYRDEPEFHAPLFEDDPPPTIGRILVVALAVVIMALCGLVRF